MAILSKNTTIAGKKPLLPSHNYIGTDTSNESLGVSYQVLTDDIDINNIVTEGNYTLNDITSVTNGPSGITLTGISNSSHLIVARNYKDSYLTQILTIRNNMWIRYKSNNIWYSWKKIWTEETQGGGSGLNADTVDGQHASNFVRIIQCSDFSDIAGAFSGFYQIYNDGEIITTSPTTSGTRWGCIISNERIQGSALHIAFDYDQPDSIYTRMYSMYGYSSWQKIWTTGNHGIGSGLNADLLDGKHISELAPYDLGVNPNLSTLVTAGLYRYQDSNGKESYVLVLDYTDKWVVQIQLTANNVVRRYKDYPIDENEWTVWHSISNANYDPNTDYMANGQTIASGLRDANKYGLRIGDVINNNYVGLSEYDTCYIHNKMLEERTNIVPTYTYDLTSEDSITSDDMIKIPTTGWDSGINCWHMSGNITIKVPANKTYIVKIKSHFAYDQTLNMSMSSGSVMPTSEDIVSSTSKRDIIILCSAGSTASVLTITTGHHMWSTAIEIYDSSQVRLGFTITDNTINVINGDSAGLINAIKFAPSNCNIYIPEGIYNVGKCDNSDFIGVLPITQSNITFTGAGIDKTIITGHYSDEFGIIKSVMRVSGSYNTFKNFSIVSKYLQSMIGQAPALIDTGVDTLWINVGLIGAQDTIVIGNNSHYFENCYIEGTVDFVCGGEYIYNPVSPDGSTPEYEHAVLNKVSYFNNCILALKGRPIGNVICAPQGQIAFNNCIITDNDNYEYESQEGKYHLARPWGNNSVVAFIDTQYKTLPASNAYTTMGSATFMPGSGDINGRNIKNESVEDFDTLHDDILTVTDTLTIDAPIYTNLTTPDIWHTFFEDWIRIENIITVDETVETV